MAAGTFTNNRAGVLSIADNSCATVKAASTAYYTNQGYVGISAQTCTQDPVIVGTVIGFGGSGFWTVTAISATPGSTTTATEFDPVIAGQFWMMAFASVIVLYFGSKGIGAVLNFVKHA